MNEDFISNTFQNILTPSLTPEQKREIARLLAAYLNSYDFALRVQSVLDRYKS